MLANMTVPSAATAALNASDTASRNPTNKTMPKDNRRDRIRLTMPLPTRGGAFQMRSRSSCNSTKAVVAPSSSAPNADDQAHHSAAKIAGAFEYVVDRGTAGFAEQSAKLADDCFLRSIAAEKEACDGDRNDEQGRERKSGVIGERRPHAGRTVVKPSVHGLLE
jgi:hypothetical protein